MLQGKYTHHCIEWDFDLIDETCTEIMACNCYRPEPSNLTSIKAEYLNELVAYNEARERVFDEF
jgi:hypothetical protein